MASLISGKTRKLTIYGFESNKIRKDKLSNLSSEQGFSVMFNPEKFSRKYEVQTPKSAKRSRRAPKELKLLEFSLEFFIDATGAIGPIPFNEKSKSSKLSEYDPISQKILEFEETVFLNGKKKPKFLVIEWGPYRRLGTIKNISIDYSMFKRDGTPLRANIKADFNEDAFQGPASISNGTDSKVTQQKTTSDSENLPSIAHQNYGNIDKSVAIAAVNGLDTLRYLSAGRKILIPPDL